MSNCANCAVRNRAICSGLNAEELEALGQLGREITVARGEALVWEGEEALLVGNVISGVLKLGVSMADGREQIVGMVFPSDFIGRPFGKESPYDVTALTDARLCVFPRSGFDKFARQYPDLQHKLLQRTLDELDRARQWMMLLGRMNAGEKIANLIIEISTRLGNDSCTQLPAVLDEFDLPLDRQQVADVLGLTIETVSRQFTKLKEANILELPDRRKVVIKNRKRLQALAMDQAA